MASSRSTSAAVSRGSNAFGLAPLLADGLLRPVFLDDVAPWHQPDQRTATARGCSRQRPDQGVHRVSAPRPWTGTGPTLSREVARSHLDGVYLPPAALGDVYRASLARPMAIGIIDGYFERVPAVWHKHKIDQKRDDALLMLQAIKQRLAAFPDTSSGSAPAW